METASYITSFTIRPLATFRNMQIFYSPTAKEGPPQPGQPFKFTVGESCDRIKEEFNFLQAQYHKELALLLYNGSMGTDTYCDYCCSMFFPHHIRTVIESSRNIKSTTSFYLSAALRAFTGNNGATT
ncbi:groucho [Carabus blaptoides fortunei]